MENRIKIGKLGEDIAYEYLIKRGWRVFERNYRRKSDEIDIIARSDDGTLVFCEVKSFTTGGGIASFARLMPEDNLTGAKLRKISRTCEFFARQHPEIVDEEKGWRIDLLAVDIGADGKASDIRHYENI
ncbi:MAG: YraN family protein [Minisyncoccia bacterium]|jgi:putative endonuclease